MMNSYDLLVESFVDKLTTDALGVREEVNVEPFVTKYLKELEGKLNFEAKG